MLEHFFKLFRKNYDTVLELRGKGIDLIKSNMPPLAATTIIRLTNIFGIEQGLENYLDRLKRYNDSQVISFQQLVAIGGRLPTDNEVERFDKFRQRQENFRPTSTSHKGSGKQILLSR